MQTIVFRTKLFSSIVIYSSSFACLRKRVRRRLRKHRRQEGSLAIEAVRRPWDKLTSLIRPRLVGSQVVERSEISDETYTLCPRSLSSSLAAKTGVSPSPSPRFVRKVGNTLHYFENYRCTLDCGARSQGSRNSTIPTCGCGCHPPSPRSELSHSSLLICKTCDHIRPFSSIISTLLTYSKHILYLKSLRTDFKEELRTHFLYATFIRPSRIR